MQIDYCLILAAGLGTRMGVIGQKLPKVLWPVFEKSILELQVAYAKSLGINKIYINLHFKGKEIHEYCTKVSTFDDVTFLWEEPNVLDIGGAIHNLASQVEINYKGKVLILNGDQFFYLKKDELMKKLGSLGRGQALLFTYWVNSSMGYNALEVDDERFIKGIIKNNDLKPHQKVETYTGISIIDLSRIDRVPGVSKFFESVCPYHQKKISTVLLENVDYWDFGTVRRYWETMFQILRTYKTNSNHPFIRFLIQAKALKTWKIDLQKLSYHAVTKDVINLDQDHLSQCLGPSIILTGQGLKQNTTPTIFWNDSSEEVEL
jgi:NDP-sugar pyrophosphorylase family protein